MKSRSNIEGDYSALHLLHRAGQCADELFALNIGESELTPRQFEVLRAVSSQAEPSQTALVERTGIDRSTLADIVRRLVARGLLVRKRTRHDARMYAVKLTPAGENALKNAQPAVQSTNESILQALPNAERKEFLNSLNKIIEVVSANSRPSK
jgi:DNA-binding MarR family transcriptional regulator